MGNKVIVTRSKLDLLADSISAKSGETLPLTIGEMKIAVDGIVLNTQIIGDGDLNIDENDYLYFNDNAIIPTGTISISANGTYNVSRYASAEVNISGSSVQSQTKTATPSESQQIIEPDSGYLLSSVTVNAISNSYVGSGVDRRTSSNLTASGATVTAPAGYYAESASKSVASGTAGTPTASKGTVSNHSISITPSVTNTTGYITGGTLSGTAVTVYANELVSGTKSISSNGTNIDVTDYASVNVSVSSQSPSLQAKTDITPTESSQTIEADSGYDGLSSVQINAISSSYIGSGVAQKSSSDLTASGATVTAPAGYYASAATKSVDSMTLPTATSASATSGYTSKATVSRSTSDQYINIPTGYNSSGGYYKISAVANGLATTPTTTITANPSITVGSDGLITATASASQGITPTVSAGYISSGTSGTITVSGSNTSQLTTKAATTITPTESEQTAVASGVYTTGIIKVGAISDTYVGSGIDQRDETDLTASGATVTVPAGYYAEQETKSVASGTAGTPTATKGTVSNNSVTVTPSVTNTTGYITGGTQSGTAVTVSASELVSGTLSISANGTGIDVTNYASIDVAIASPEITITTSGNVSQELEPGTSYHFTSESLTSLTLTFGGQATDQYHFDFISPSTSVTLTLPQSVLMPTSFNVEKNTKYEIDIYNNYGVYAEWVWSNT